MVGFLYQPIGPGPYKLFEEKVSYQLIAGNYNRACIFHNHHNPDEGSCRQCQCHIRTAHKEGLGYRHRGRIDLYINGKQPVKQIRNRQTGICHGKGPADSVLRDNELAAGTCKTDKSICTIT